MWTPAITILLIIFVILFLYLSKKNIIEGYDARYTNTNFEACAQFCKTTENCHGFGYDKAHNICYPSQLIIAGKPLDSIFKDQYSYGNAFCNKVNAIEDPIKHPTFVDRRRNSIFVCSENHDMQPSYYLHNNGTFKNIGEGKNIDDLFDIEDYEVKSYNWPRNRYDYDQLDLLMKERENQLYTPENVTDVSRIIKPSIKTIIVPKLNKTLVPDFNLFNSQSKEHFSPLNLFESSGKTNKKIRLKNNPHVSFTEYNDYNTGKYMNDYKCVKGVSRKSCLEYCGKNSKCIGAEWNHKFYNILDICCPYSTNGVHVKRENDKKLGRFYEKHINK